MKNGECGGQRGDERKGAWIGVQIWVGRIWRTRAREVVVVVAIGKAKRKANMVGLISMVVVWVSMWVMWVGRGRGWWVIGLVMSMSGQGAM